MIEFYRNLPLHIDPIAFSIGSISVRWYGLSYVAGFLVIYLILMLRIKEHELKIDAQIYNLQFTIHNKNFKFEISNLVLDYLLVAFFSALVGGRIGFVLFYDAAYYFSHPLNIVSPYNSDGMLVGFFGMSYHGALIGIVLASHAFLKIKKINFFVWADFVVPAVALGYFFGRVGNFLNGELYGRVTNIFLGMHFAADPIHLRHPSQLYEAFLEGILLFVVLWRMRSVSRSKKWKEGTLFATYLIGYGIVRIFAEQLRQPDAQLGILFQYFTMGQILSLFMILSGVTLLILKNGK